MKDFKTGEKVPLFTKDDLFAAKVMGAAVAYAFASVAILYPMQEKESKAQMRADISEASPVVEPLISQASLTFDTLK